jgi:4-amino-4-deoxy-L-arabinose transferase-like glycosyltransferase
MDTVATDSAYYLWIAEYFQSGDVERGLIGFGGTHPLYSILTALAGTLCGDTIAGAYLVSITASALGVLGLYLLVRLWWNWQVAGWTALLALFHPVLSVECAEVMQTGLFLCLLIWALYSYSLGLRRWWLGYLLSGLFSGLAFLTRPEGVYLIPLLSGAWLLSVIVAWRKGANLPPLGESRLRTVVRNTLALIVTGVFLLLTAGPYLVWIRARTGAWALSVRPSSAFLMGGAGLETPPPPNPFPSPPAPPCTTPGTQDPCSGAETTTATRDPQPQAVPPSRKRGLFREASRALQGALYGPLIPFVLLGLSLGRRAGVPWTYYGASLGLFLVPLVPAVLLSALSRGSHPVSHRYFLPITCAALPWAALGLLEASRWLRSRVWDSPTRILRRGVAPVLQSGLLILLISKSMVPPRAGEGAFVEAGEWVRTSGLFKQVAWVTGDKLAYYCGISFQQGTRPGETGHPTSEFTNECKRRDVRLVVLDEKSLSKLPSDFLMTVRALGFLEIARFPRIPQSRRVSVYVFLKS